MSKELAKAYDPATVEERIYRAWEDSGVFAPSGEGEPFCIVMPPPNVTGVLHIGHALDNSLQDAIARRRRMQGRKTLWLPGTDHAGIATQNVVERELAKEGKSRHDLGREAFVERVWEWKRQSGGRIVQQLKRLGASCDWSRERFTMDEGLSRAVREIFVRLYDEGLIYRGKRIINWCPFCLTALSDIEVEYKDIDGELVQIRYPLKDAPGFVTVATTRVETMLADTGVAVNPDDDRWRELVGKTAILPLVGRELPIVADDTVDPAFGTGALKVTPALDPVDWEIAQRHGLPSVELMTPDATLNQNAGEFAGMDRFEAREAITARLRQQGLVAGEIRPYLHSVGHCYRSGTQVETLLSEQWFVRVGPLAERAIEAVREGRTRFVPERYTRNYMDWMENLRDWCISRQLWWGHRIPVYTCANGHEFAAREAPTTCPVDGDGELTQDPDVLDTWFSSALWPFSTLGWPDETEDVKTFYPNDVLVTGYDIITFWVSRMMMMGLHTMDEVPFREVNIHGLVRDFRGKKMSKSFGNVIDPIEMIDRYGADAVRMTLLRSATLGADVPLAEKWIEGDRNFANKLWNASRFGLMNLPSGPVPLPSREGWSLADRWILSRLATVIAEVDEAIERYDFAHAAQALRQFTWSELCDWYIEWVKGAFASTDDVKADAARGVFTYVLTNVLRLLHPFMPFITEELHAALVGEDAITAPWPQADGSHSDLAAEQEFGFLMSVVSALRRFRADHQLQPGIRPGASATISDTRLAGTLSSELERVTTLARWGRLDLREDELQSPAARIVVPGAVIEVPLAGILDIDAERARLNREVAALGNEAEGVRRKLANADFVAKAPDEVVEAQRDRLADLEGRQRELRRALEELG